MGGRIQVSGIGGSLFAKVSALIAICSVLLLSNAIGVQALTVFLADHGTDVRNSTGDLLALGNLTLEIYDAMTGGNQVYSHDFNGSIINGSWNVQISAGLEFGKTYYKDYMINGEDLSFDGNGRLAFTSPLGYINNASMLNFSLINSCPGGSSIRLVYENGSVECQTGGAGSTANATYQSAWEFATNRTHIPYFSDLNTSNASYVTWVRWNLTNSSYVDWLHFNITNASYVDWLHYNSTNATYDSLITSAVKYGTWNSTNATYDALVTTAVRYSTWNATNESYVIWTRWNITNATYDALLRTAMIYSAWNSTNATYDSLLGTAMLYSAWNATNESYVA